jgi:hypothetical protein
MERHREKGRRELLRRLLEKYERGQMYGRPAPWPRDVIVRIDPKEFPRAFSPDGREELADLSQAAIDLAHAGAARIVHFKGLPEERPQEVRLGPGEVARACEMARSEGFEPLEESLDALAAAADRTRNADLPDWMHAFLDRAAAGARSADLSPLGMSRERLKRERVEVLDSLRAAAALARGASGWERVVSERIFSDSKRLGAIRAKVAEFLLRADPRWDGIEPEDSLDVLEAYGVRRKPGLIRCAGEAEIAFGGRTYLLGDFRPTAHLPEEWAGAWVKAVIDDRPEWITTIENEFPFLSYALEAGGPRGLGERRELAVYTAGFPSTTLLESLAGIASRAPSIRFRHWGDADVGGLRIWWLLRSRLDRPVELFRTRKEWLEDEAARGRELSALEKRGLERLREELRASPAASAPDLTGAFDLIDALLRLGRKVEQERW